MTQQWRWATLSASLIAGLLVSSSSVRAEDFDSLPPSIDDAFPSAPGDDFFPDVSVPPQEPEQGWADDSFPAEEEPVTAQEPTQISAPVESEVLTPETAAAGTADEAFDLKTKALEEKVNDLKEKIFRTKYRLTTLAETVLGGVVNSGAKLALWHRNELGSSYVLVSAAYTLDGAPLYTKVDESGDLNDREEFIVFDQRILPGQHQISVQYELRGHGYGVFSYLEGMRVKLRTSHTFNVEPGKVTKLTSLVHEKSGLTLEFEDKPSVRFEMNVSKDIAPLSDDLASPANAAQAKSDGTIP